MTMALPTQRNGVDLVDRSEAADAVLGEALSLAKLLCERLSSSSLIEQSDAFRIRLIRAQALSVADLLTELVATSRKKRESPPA